MASRQSPSMDQGSRDFPTTPQFREGLSKESWSWSIIALNDLGILCTMHQPSGWGQGGHHPLSMLQWILPRCPFYFSHACYRCISHTVCCLANNGLLLTQTKKKPLGQSLLHFFCGFFALWNVWKVCNEVNEMLCTFNKENRIDLAATHHYGTEEVEQ